MINIRTGLFETNSSSIHTLVFVEESDYNKWAQGNLYFNMCYKDYNSYKYGDIKYKKANKFVSYEEAKALDENFPYPEDEMYRGWSGFEYWDEKEKRYKIRNFLTLEEFFAYCGYDIFDKEYITEHGDLIHAVGYYGHD